MVHIEASIIRVNVVAVVVIIAIIVEMSGDGRRNRDLSFLIGTATITTTAIDEVTRLPDI